MRLSLSVTAALFALLAAGSSPASASTATTADGPLRYVAGVGETNNVSFSRVSGDTFKVVELGATIQAGQGCMQETPNQVTCTTGPGRSLIATLGDGLDKAVSKTSRSVQFYGEAGGDRLAGASGRDLIDGGDGDDLVSGGQGRDTVRGGPGKDQLYGGSGSDVLQGGDGVDLLIGGPGNDSEQGGSGDDVLRQTNQPDGADTLIGGDGMDGVDYSARAAPVKVDLNDARDDGDIRSNERDDVRQSVDLVLGGAGSDILLGRETSSDVLIGGTGGDYLDGRRGVDRLNGGPGPDQIAARDLSSDDISCGDDNDSVAADPRDLVATDCEKTRRTAAISFNREGQARYPTLYIHLRCPPTAFKFCGGKLIIQTSGKVKTRGGRRILTAAVKRFTLAAGSDRVVGIRLRAAIKPFLKGHSLPVRARISGFDGAGPARPHAQRFRIRRL